MKLNLPKYKRLLKNYIDIQDEKSLYQAGQVSKLFLKNNVPLEEIINLHNIALTELYPDLAVEYKHAMDFLLETVIFYSMETQKDWELQAEQLALKSEIEIAAGMQERLLLSDKPHVDGLDIGVISVPASQMNGDYYHFVIDHDGSFQVAIADVIGKGVPAALSMSMIKYSMESFSEELKSPNRTLKNLNRVVERNVDSNMFISMFYGRYLPTDATFQYASAGHEPGFYYDAATNTFSTIETEGLVLGVLPETTYPQYELQMSGGDMIILLTDGVTECKQDEQFIEREEVLSVIKKYAHLPPQKHVEHVYSYFEKLSNYEIRDDFTLVVLKKNV